MIKAPIDLQDLRRRIYVKAKAEPSWRFWGLYVHVCKMETLYEAYAMAKTNNGAPGIDGVTFEAIEAGGVEAFLEQIRDELRLADVSSDAEPAARRSRRTGARSASSRSRPSGTAWSRERSSSSWSPIFEADFQPGSFGYRPKRTAHEAVHRVAEAIVQVQDARHRRRPASLLRQRAA